MSKINGKNGNGKTEEKKTEIKRKFLFVSIDALCSDMAWHIMKEGHEVKFYVRDKNENDIADGIVNKVDNWESEISWADVIVFDDVGFGEDADRLRKEGKLVIGGSVYTDKLEDDREFGQTELKSVNVNVLPNWAFTNFDHAIRFVRENPGRYVLKPSGRAQNDKELLFIGREDDGRDILEILEHYKKNWSEKIKEFLLQKYAPGVEIAVGAFFNGKEFMLPINVNFEHKRMFNNDIGPMAGEMGTLMYWSQPNKIFKATLGKMKEKLAKAGYVGYIDINCIVNAKGIYPLEFTSRFGYPTISIHFEGILNPVNEFLYGMASGEMKEFRTKKGFQMGVVIAVPPYPFNDIAAFKRYSENASIIFKKPVLDGVHIGDVKFIDGDWRLAGASGYVLVITASGSTVEHARRLAYKRVENIVLPNMFYRTDIGLKWGHESDKLQTWGYLY